MGLDTIKAIIFDAEGVVVDTELLWDKSQIEVLGKRGLLYNREYLKPRMVGQTLLVGAQLIIDYYGLNESPQELAKERQHIIQDLFETEIGFIDGFLSFVKLLRTEGYSFSIATAMSKELMVKVEKKLSLKEIFKDHIYFIQDVGNKSKPAPDVFLLAANKLNVNPANCLVIEDAPHGIEAANRAGMVSIGLTTTFSKRHLSGADYIVENFKEIISLLKLEGSTNIDD